MSKLSITGCLESLREFLEKEVAPEISLLKEKSEMKEYVNPYVGLVTLPHKNFMPVNFQVPHILIGLVSGSNDASNDNKVDIRIQCATYGGDIQFEEDANLPDETGYVDLLNLEELVMHKLIQKAVIGNCVVDTNFSFGIYDEEFTYPYWYGYIQFTLNIPTMNRQMLEF